MTSEPSVTLARNADQKIHHDLLRVHGMVVLCEPFEGQLAIHMGWLSIGVFAESQLPNA